jgi:hypothetical protein
MNESRICDNIALAPGLIVRTEEENREMDQLLKYMSGPSSVSYDDDFDDIEAHAVVFCTIFKAEEYDEDDDDDFDDCDWPEEDDERF